MQVRLAAAHRLAKQGHHDGTDVLRTVAASGDKEGLLAYVTLRKLGEQVPPPPGLASLLMSGDVTTRLVVLDFVRDLPSADAGRLVKIAVLDPMPVVRRRVAEVAAELYRTTRLTRYLRVVRSLRNDSDLLVRAQAATRRFIGSVCEECSPGGSWQRRPEQVKNPLTTRPQQNQVRRFCQEWASAARRRRRTRAVSNRQRSDAGSFGRPISIPVGKHRISYLGGGQDIYHPGAQPTKGENPGVAGRSILSGCQGCTGTEGSAARARKHRQASSVGSARKGRHKLASGSVLAAGSGSMRPGSARPSADRIQPRAQHSRWATAPRNERSASGRTDPLVEQSKPHPGLHDGRRTLRDDTRISVPRPAANRHRQRPDPHGLRNALGGITKVTACQ